MEALDGPDPSAVLQPRAEAAQTRGGLDGIVVSTTEGIRIAHPDPKLIGKHVVGPYKKAAHGESFTHIVVDPLGLSVYAAVPVFRPDGSVAGVVYPEITVKSVNKEVQRQLPVLLGGASGALVLAGGGSALVSWRLRRQTRGLEPAEMTRMYEHHDAVLHAVRESVLIVGSDGRLLLANDEARRLLDLPADAEQREVTGLRVVTFPTVPISPPLGLGSGLPFETADLQLPAGSRLALFTDGLVENRVRDLDTGFSLLQRALAHPDQTPEQTCQTVIDALLPPRPSDDIALLVARTRILDAHQVAEWDVPGDPTAVASIRAACARRLGAWGLDHMAFTTELIVSELVTNAIRYGAAPIRLRLLQDHSVLICEVSDGSSTSPHRRAATTDECGRGLFLIAQFTQRWGTRYTARGKVIWAEQSLRGDAASPGEAPFDDILDQWDDTALWRRS
ncbi:SpoIIE family protein phosphatase [Streptomyces sp. TRM68367]|uniref:SpoIIE family protein phosphatase n=1 Tax=Streptomyces sp. TRM68367 TaxID=2758415 RepID=UPI0037DD62D4